MDEVLTWEEIERRFPGEWVLIDEPEITGDLSVARGLVRYHGPDKAQADALIRHLKLTNVAVLFIGDPIPEGVIVVL
jgi:hypothetical protein